MPKKVDHVKQREKIAVATWNVIAKGGMEKATVRNIAREAGVSVGSLRHYFSTQAELLSFAMKLVSERVSQRINEIDFSMPPLDAMKRMIREVLPLEDDTKKEMEVWFAFTQKALSEPELQPLSKEVYLKMRYGFEQVIKTLVKLDLARPNINVELEVDRLYALIDGLAIHGLMHPEYLSNEMIESILDSHLKSLCKQEVL
ncbi:MAG: TetR family transcriptional regulator [Bacillaceae bacterium]|jgi:AcrR family transcriptional regulator|uniref:TetR family transcriptional regulator n=2 Tax=Aeribacillus TaxID=1055323 RepID=A0A165WA22_9BACI|nr:MULTISPECIES: TetR/AcrR family transcriptional regulator [Aeribacillus]AXI39687.1 TetR family transcriptional regulator [Bacillaceae bacterium ZC4]REJ20583.1 MAG: TetR family transcriptional regulator [Bacillaceae bacterium]ASS91103.1 TetR family transcriptional regulator [Aeribacillus pallidus]KZN94795.1 TetR family transcriptional regulator [Aeribacillus pallidus]MDR9792198.1 TetR/AcrR family transcriptional regulator [Aeribacillus pallidus]